MDMRDDKGKREGALSALMKFSDDRAALTYVGCALSVVAQLLGFIPYICIWLAARDLIAVAPNWSQATEIATYGWAALAFSVLSILIYFAGLMCTHLAAFRTATNIRKQTTAHLLRVPLGYFDSHATGALRRVIDGCAGNTEQLLAHMLPDTAGSIAMVLGTIVIMLVFDWRLGLACMVPVVISMLCMMKMMTKRGMDFMAMYQDALVRMNKTGTEYVRGIPVVKVFQQTVYSFKAFHDSIVDYSNMAMSYTVNWCQLPQVINLTALNGLVVFLVPLTILLAPGEASLQGFIVNFAFYAVFSALVPTAMTKVMFMSQAFQTANDAVSRVREIMNAPTLEEPADPKSPNGASIEFRDVSFTYEGALSPALSHVSFRVDEGSTVALVGPSGGGKTTAASLVPRFWDVSSGCVEVGGVDVRDMRTGDLMADVAFVFQSNRLFADTLLENVRAAKPIATREEALAALSVAQCGDILEKLPQGADTLIGVGGTYLSGGEVQRVALARAILKDAPIVVLDEATAFADPENEALIQRALGNLAHGRTVLMIAHRLSTVVNADKIIVLEAGEVAEQGTHGELVAKGGLYSRMWAEYERAVTWKISAAGNADAACEACDDAAVAVARADAVTRADAAEGGEA